MPTVTRIGALRVTIYPNDHPPPHVHVIGAEGEAVFHLNCPEGPPTLRASLGFNAATIRRIAADLTPLIAKCCHDWNTIHGYL